MIEWSVLYRAIPTSPKKKKKIMPMIIIFKGPASVLLLHPSCQDSLKLCLEERLSMQFSRWWETLLCRAVELISGLTEASPWLTWNLKTLPSLRNSVPLGSYILDFVIQAVLITAFWDSFNLFQGTVLLQTRCPSNLKWG